MKPLCVVSCPIDTFSGYGARSRDFVKALIQLKDKEWDIKILPQRWGDCPWNFLDQDDSLRSYFIGKLETQPDIWFQITVPNEFTPVGKYNIGVTAGIETTLMPSSFIEGFNRMNINLVSSNHSKHVALNSQFEKVDKNTKQKVGVLKCEKPVEVLFEGLNLDKYFKIQNFDSSVSLLKDIPEQFCFLYTGHWLPGVYGEDRKNTALCIKTFLETFKGIKKPKPALILKTNQVDYSLLDREEILFKINAIRKKVDGELPNIYLLHGEITDEEMNLLNNDPKVKSFLNFTKGEGFGRPLIESAITGKPLVVSNWSGHVDFIHPDYNVLVGGDLKNLHKSASNEFLLKESQWFNINTDIASKAMKDIFKNYKKYISQSRKQTQYIKNNFSLAEMTKRLNIFLPKIDPAPQIQKINLPKLKKIGDKQETPKIKLPKLKKIEA